MRQRLMKIDGAYTADQAQDRLRVISHMRDEVLTENPVNFTNYCQRHLAGRAGDGDLMVDLLEELQEELGMGFHGTWDEMAEKFLQPN